MKEVLIKYLLLSVALGIMVVYVYTGKVEKVDYRVMAQYTCSGTCYVTYGTCAGLGRVDASGTCAAGSVCCGGPVPTAEPVCNAGSTCMTAGGGETCATLGHYNGSGTCVYGICCGAAIPTPTPPPLCPIECEYNCTNAGLSCDAMVRCSRENISGCTDPGVETQPWTSGYCVDECWTGTSGCVALTCTNTCGLGGCPTGCGSIDNCGGVSCNACPGTIGTTPAPTPASCVPNCACAATLCSTQTCVNNCGTSCYGTLYPSSPSAPTLSSPVNGAVLAGGNINLTWVAPISWGQCPVANTYTVCVGTDSLSPCSGSMFPNLPSTSLTMVYNQSTPGVYYWTVGANNGTGIPTVYSATRSFVVNSTPVVNSLTIVNSVGTTLVAEAGSRNQICDATIKNSSMPRRATFIINASDGNGGANISSMNLTWNGRSWPAVLQAPVGNNRTGMVTVDFASGDNATGTYPLVATAIDAYSATGTNNSRSWKVWDCNVPVSGSVYDSSSEALGAVCSTGSGFNTLASAAVNFRWVSVGATIVNAATINTYSGLNLSWGENYAVVPNSDLLVSGLVTRWIDIGVGTTNCGIAQNLNNTTIDPYNVNPRFQVDFSGITNQEPWFQASGGGIQAAGGVENMVPITCANEPSLCTASMSRESAVGAADNGLVSGSALTNNSGCSITGSGAMCAFGAPNNWYRNGSSLSSSDRYNYQFFYDRYYSALGLGITLGPAATMSDVIGRGGTGVFLVDGDFNVDVDNILPANSFLMIVSRGTITFLNTVNNSAGMFVADSGIGTSPGVNTGLVIDGLLYSSSGNVRLNRGFADKLDNNTNPAVLVRYRPDLLFSMPGNLFRLLSNWRQF